MFHRLTEGRMFMLNPETINQRYQKLASPIPLPSEFDYLQPRTYSVTPGDRNLDEPAPRTWVPARAFRRPARYKDVSDRQSFAFRWLPYCPGRITFIPYNGTPIWSGTFTGCWFVVFRARTNGQTYVAHLGKQAQGPGTSAIHQAWIDASDDIQVLDAYNPMYDQLDNGFATANANDLKDRRFCGSGGSVLAAITNNHSITFATRPNPTSNPVEPVYKVFSRVRLRDRRTQLHQDVFGTGMPLVGPEQSAARVF